MIGRPKKRSPAPRANAGNRACIIPTPSNTTGRVFSYHKKERGTLDFDSINRMALAAFPAVLARILPRGKFIGREYVALNPTRADHRPGSFKIRLSGSRAGSWADFATGERGGDSVSLVAYLENVSQGEAARMLARMLGLEMGGRRNE
jgi:hypothetical protein